MLTDSLPKPHLPYTEREKGTEGRRGADAETDGCSGTQIQKDNPRRAHFSTIFLRLYRAAAVLSTCARNSYLPGVLQFSQKRGDPHCNIHNAHCSMQQKKHGHLQIRAIVAGCVSFCLFYESLSRILRASVRSLKLRLCLPLLRMKAALAVLTVSRRRISTLPSPSSTRPSVLFPALPPPSSLCMGRVLSGGTCCNSSLS